MAHHFKLLGTHGCVGLEETDFVVHLARDEMEMRVEDDLARCRAVVEHEVESFRLRRRDNTRPDALRELEKFVAERLVHIQKIRAVFLRHEERVSCRARVDVQKCQEIHRLSDSLRRDAAIDYFAE